MAKNPNKTLQNRVDKKAETLTALLTSETKTEAAARLGIARPTLYERIEKYDLNDYLNRYYEDAMEVLTKGTIQAAKKQVALTDSKQDKIALDATREVLGNVGISPSKQASVQVNIANVLQKEREEFNFDE